MMMTDCRTSISDTCLLITIVALLSVPLAANAQDVLNTTTPVPVTSPSTAASAPPAAADAAASPTGLFEEPHLLARSMRVAIEKFGDSRQAKDGWYPELSNMIAGSGFVSLGPGYRQYLFDKHAFVDGSTAVSWHFYKMAQARFEVPDFANGHVTAGAQGMWQDNTQINYFGIGRDSASEDQSQYRLKTTDVVGYGRAQFRNSVFVGGNFGWLDRPQLLTTAGTFKPSFPEAQEQFPTDPGMQLEEQPGFLHGEMYVLGDTRDYPSHPTQGGLYRAAVTAFSDRDTGTFSFRQYDAEVARFIPLGTPNWILALHAWTVFSDVPHGHEIPFYRLPSLGGQNTLRSYSNFRFHDQNAALVSAESRWAVFSHLDGALFVDAGNVAPRYGDLDVSKISVGAGARLHTQRATWGRADIAHGAEGWHFLVRTGDPFQFTGRTRRIVAVPYVP